MDYPKDDTGVAQSNLRRWEQPGVKAPGTANKTTVLPFHSSLGSYSIGIPQALISDFSLSNGTYLIQVSRLDQDYRVQLAHLNLIPLGKVSPALRPDIVMDLY